MPSRACRFKSCPQRSILFLLRAHSLRSVPARWKSIDGKSRRSRRCVPAGNACCIFPQAFSAVQRKKAVRHPALSAQPFQLLLDAPPAILWDLPGPLRVAKRSTGCKRTCAFGALVRRQGEHGCIFPQAFSAVQRKKAVRHPALSAHIFLKMLYSSFHAEIYPSTASFPSGVSE